MNQRTHAAAQRTQHHTRRWAVGNCLALALAGALLASCAPADPEDTPGDENGIMHDIHASPEQSAIEKWSPQIAQEASDVATNAATDY